MNQNARSKNITPNEDNFFLPNFCAVNSVFILSIGAELIAVMLILATGDILSQSWDELGLLSVFVQWIALASAGVLCLSRHWLAKLSLPFAAVSAYLLIVITTIRKSDILKVAEKVKLCCYHTIKSYEPLPPHQK